MKKIAYTITTAFILAACSSEPTATQTTQTQDPLKDILAKKTTVVTPAQNTQPENPFFNQSSAPVSQTGFLANPNVQAFIQYQNQKNGLDINYLTNFFSQVNYRGNLINTMNRPATSTPWYKFKTSNSGAAKINPAHVLPTKPQHNQRRRQPLWRASRADCCHFGH